MTLGITWQALCNTFAFTLTLILSASCSRPLLEGTEDSGGGVTVTGAFFDWKPDTSAFSEGLFILLDANTNEVFKSTLIEKEKPSFKIENVPVKGKYYGILLNKKFEPTAYLQKTQSDGKAQRVFKFGSTGGRLGTIVVRDSLLQSSNHSDLDFQAATGSGTLTEKEFATDFSTNFVHNSDIDEDGIPNVLDINLDGDSISNIFDAATYSSKSSKIFDSAIPAQYNYGYGIPKGGYFKCDYLKTPLNRDNSTFNLRYSCVLKLGGGIAEGVRLTTTKVYLDNAKSWDTGSAFDWEMTDDGLKGDLIASDGLWSANFSIPNSTESFQEQTIIATAKMQDGTTKSYITNLEPDLIFEAIEKIPLATFSAEDLLTISFSLEKLNTTEGVQISATLLKEADDTVIYTFNAKPERANEHIFRNVNDIIPLTPEKYRVLVKIAAPSALPGLLGSAFEIYSLPIDYPPVPSP